MGFKGMMPVLVMSAFWLLMPFCVLAVTPDVRLPEWYRLQTIPTSWNPKTGELRLQVTFEAVETAVLEISASLNAPADFKINTPQARMDKIEAGKKWVSMHVMRAPKAFDGWLELVFHARPLPETMLKRVENIATLTPLTKEVLKGEVNALKTPLPCGFSLPLHLDENIAVFLPREMLFSPIEISATRTLLLWAPEVVLGIGSLSKTFDAFRQALAKNDFPSAQASLRLVENLLGSGSETVLMKSSSGAEFQAQRAQLLGAVRVSLAALIGRETPADALKDLQSLLKTLKPSYLNGFIYANMGLLGNRDGKIAQAREHFRKALEIFPAWPLVEKRQENLK